MTAQFIVGTLLFMLAVGFTANLWLQALRRVEFRDIANFYRVGMIALALSTSGLVWAQVFSVVEVQAGQAAFNGLSAMLVVFVLFSWVRLSFIGLKFDLTHQALPQS